MKLKRNLLAVAVASILMSGAYVSAARAADDQGAGYAQAPGAAKPDATDAPAAQDTAGDKTKAPAKPTDESAVNLGEIKVTGIRSAIEQAISVKENSNEIVEAISAEDIGKLPDNSIAESLARLPGLAAQRIGGRASTVSLRGFAGDFSGTLLNGREQVSTGDNRAIEFDQYPSELISGVVVYKTPESSLIGQGIAGTIDLQTFRPLDFSKRVMQVGIRGSHDSLGAVNANTSNNGYRANFSYINQFADRTFGVAFGYARLKQPVQDERWESWGYAGANPVTDASGNVTGYQIGGQDVPQGTIALGGNKVYADSTEGTRDAVYTTLEWRPTENYTSTLDLYYSKFKQETLYGGFEEGLVYGNGTTLSDATISNGQVVSGTWANVKPVIRHELDHHDDDIRSIGWNNKFALGGGWHAMTDLSYARANTNQSFLEEYAGTVPGSPGSTDTWSYAIDQNTGLPTYNVGLNYADSNIIKLVDSGGWGQDGYIKFPKVTDDLKAGRVDLSKDINSAISKFDVGINYNRREKTRESGEFFVNLPGGTSSYADVPSGCLQSSTYLGYVGFPSILSWDVGCVYRQSYVLKPNYNQDITNKDWHVTEKVGTAYFKFDLDTDIFGMPLRGNFGAQYVHVSQDSQAFAVANADAVNGVAPVSDGTSYSNVLPDLNLVLSLPVDQYLRFGAGKEIVRPRLDQMRASTEYSINLTPGSSTGVTSCLNTATGETVPCRFEGNGGNPRLKPFVANAYDLSYEKYWDNRAYVAATYFYKQLKTYIYQQTLIHDFAGVPNPSNGNLEPSSSTGIFTEPANGTGGYMRGQEFTVSMPLDILWSPLDGFGVQASYSHTNSSISPDGPGTSSPFPGLSKYVSQATVYYEKAGWSARVAATHRSDFLGEVQAFGADQEFHDVRAETITDVQLGYTFQPGSRFENLTILLQAQNVFNEPYREYYGTRDQPRQYTVYGRQYLLGINYKF
ncbi:MAG: TonB-dependent receptor [Rudaea sp.]